MAHLLNTDWLLQQGARVPTSGGAVVAYLCTKHRVFCYGRVADFKCQNKGRYELGILMEFRDLEIPESPAHLQIRLGQAPAQAAGDLLSDRLTAKRRRKEEMQGRVSVNQVDGVLDKGDGKKEFDNSTVKRRRSPTSTDGSAPVMPDLEQEFPDDDAVRQPPAPASPIYEAVTWEDPQPMSMETSSNQALRGQAMHLIC